MQDRAQGVTEDEPGAAQCDPNPRALLDQVDKSTETEKGAGGNNYADFIRQQKAEAAQTSRDISAAIPKRAMETALRNGLKSVETIKQERRLTTGRMDRRAITRANMGALDVFAQRAHTPGVSTAVCIMLDCSGSMTEKTNYRTAQGFHAQTSRWVAAAAVLAVLVPAIERANAQSAVFGFGSDLSSAAEAYTVFKVKSWTQRAGTFHPLTPTGLLGAVPMGLTPMQREARFASNETLARKAERRIVLWVCDGQPNNAGSARREIERQRARGVEHKAIGLGATFEFLNLFGADHAALTDNPTDLPALIERMLTTSTATSKRQQ